MKEIKASMAGTVWKVLVAPGQMVEDGQDVLILESMKMEIPHPAEVSGKVAVVHVREGQFVNEGDLLVALE